MTHYREKNVTLSEVSTSCGREVYILIEAPIGLCFTDSVRTLLEMYQAERDSCGLDDQSEVYMKFHVSDMANQEQHLRNCLAGRQSTCMYSVCGQPPASGSEISLEAYLMKPDKGNSMDKKYHDMDRELHVVHGPYESLWMNLQPDINGNSFDQSLQLFQDLKSRLDKKNATLSDHLMRTWIYVHDIDHNYQGLVDARCQVFNREGLTEKTHYVASTGIGAHGHDPEALVSMDAFSVKGYKSGQIFYLEAPDHLCPTSDYGVTFERGTVLVFGDRKHAYISGTASIDNNGQVLFPGSPEKQSKRVLENMDALLEKGGMTLSHLKYLIVYLRDLADESAVRCFLNKNLPDGIPFLMLKGAVCRPAWLVEMEGVAACEFDEDRYAPFF